MGEPLDLAVLRNYFERFNEELPSSLGPKMMAYFGNPNIRTGTYCDMEESIERLAPVYHADMPVSQACESIHLFCREILLYFTAATKVPSFNARIMFSQLNEKTPEAYVEAFKEYARIVRTLRGREEAKQGKPTELSIPAVTDKPSENKG